MDRKIAVVYDVLVAITTIFCVNRRRPVRAEQQS